MVTIQYQIILKIEMRLLVLPNHYLFLLIRV